MPDAKPKANFDASCDFCKIAHGQLAADVVAETEDWIAFFPIDPATPGHTLVVPREHVADYWELDRATLAQSVMQGCYEVGRALRDTIKCEGLNLVTSAGSAAEQTVFHLHMHVVPRWHDDKFGEIWPQPGKYSRDDVDDIIPRLRQALKRD